MVESSQFSMLEREKIVLLSQASLFESSEDAIEARDYLFSFRKLNEEIVKKFNIGYVPLRVQNRKISGRIVFPIYDCHNNLIAISTRDFRNQDKNRGHWHESFEKKYHFFGFNQALSAMKEKNEVILVEGQFDVMSMHANGFTNCIGILGSHMSNFHAYLIARHVDSIVFSFDNDIAGKNANKESVNVMSKTGLAYDKRISFFSVDIGSYKDPDDLLKDAGREEMEMCINSSRNRKKKYDKEQWTADVFDLSID